MANLLQFEKVDDQTFKVTSAKPYGFFVTLYGVCCRQRPGDQW